MNTKQIILFLLLTAMLMLLSYSLLESLSLHSRNRISIAIASLIVADILVLSKFFLKYLK